MSRVRASYQSIGAARSPEQVQRRRHGPVPQVCGRSHPPRPAEITDASAHVAEQNQTRGAPAGTSAVAPHQTHSRCTDAMPQRYSPGRSARARPSPSQGDSRRSGGAGGAAAHARPIAVTVELTRNTTPSTWASCTRFYLLAECLGAPAAGRGLVPQGPRGRSFPTSLASVDVGKVAGFWRATLWGRMALSGRPPAIGRARRRSLRALTSRSTVGSLRAPTVCRSRSSEHGAT